MGVETVKMHLKAKGFSGQVLEFETSSATVALAAQAVGCEPARIAKTLSFKNGDGCVLVVTAGDCKVDNGRFKAQFGMKAKMLTPEEVVTFTGHAIGGVCPFAITNESVRVYMDMSLKRFETVFPACGSSNSAVELTVEQLYDYANAVEMVDVCK